MGACVHLTSGDRLDEQVSEPQDRTVHHRRVARGDQLALTSENQSVVLFHQQHKDVFEQDNVKLVRAILAEAPCQQPVEYQLVTCQIKVLKTKDNKFFFNDLSSFFSCLYRMTLNLI